MSLDIVEEWLTVFSLPQLNVETMSSNKNCKPGTVHLFITLSELGKTVKHLLLNIVSLKQYRGS